MTGALLFFRNTAVTNSAQSVVFTTGGDTCTIRAFNIINDYDYSVYLKFYNTANTSVTVGTTAIIGTLKIPAKGTIFCNITEGNSDTGTGGQYLNFNSAVSIACTKNLADSDTTSVGTGIYVELQTQKIL